MLCKAREFPRLCRWNRERLRQLGLLGGRARGDLMEAFNDLMGTVNGLVWGWPMIILLLGTGVFLSVGLRFYTILNIPYAFSLLRPGHKPHGEGDITPFQALTTALSATIGNGNIVGVAAAIIIGGPGAVFWMWIVALVGMATKFGEAVLAVKYRETDSRGRFQGGPMYYIKNGMGKNWAWLGWLFAFFAMIAAFGIGNMFQANAVAEAIAGPVLGHVAETAPHENAKLVVGFILSGLTLAVIVGGVKRIGTVAQYLMPFMAAIYVIAGLAVIMMNVQQVPAAFSMIFNYAFTGTAAGGGFAGGLIIVAMRFGFARGIFSNEAGLGSAAIAHAAAKTDDPVRQGTVAMLGTFIDTLIVCTITALAILTVSFSDPREFTEVQHIELAADGSVASETWVCATGDDQDAIAAQREAITSGIPFEGEIGRAHV